MKQQHDNRVVVVTGASQGIGRAIAERFKAAGDRVVALDIRAGDLAPPDGRSGAGIEFRQMDVTVAAEVEQVLASVFADHSRLNVLVNNAGITFDKSLTSMTEADWDLMMNINLKGVFLCCKYALAPMRRSGGGSIVNIGSLEGIACNPLHTAYAASKGGVHALTRALAVDLGPEGIRCNAVCPGWINTAFNDAYFDCLKNRETGIQAITALHPACRLGTPEDVAETVFWLAGDAAGFITGQEVVVDGGRLCRPSLPDFDAMEKRDAI
jgi:meso-butanediol dehydrogenase/(S,S)-butanediol dehydrogenase/diacetyl reductase